MVSTSVQIRNTRDRINRKLDELQIPRNERNRFVVYNYHSLNDNHSLAILSERRGVRLFFDEYEQMADIPYIKGSYYTSSPISNIYDSKTYSLMRQAHDGHYFGEEEDDLINGYMSITGEYSQHRRILNPLERRLGINGRPQTRRNGIWEDDNPTMTVGRRRLDERWTIEAAEDLESMYSLDLEEEMINIIAEEQINIIAEEQQPVQSIFNRHDDPEDMNDDDQYLYRLGL